jgi:hypothetical protein
MQVMIQFEDDVEKDGNPQIGHPTSKVTGLSSGPKLGTQGLTARQRKACRTDVIQLRPRLIYAAFGGL